MARPIFLALLLGWLWRLILLCVLFHRIARLDLALVPTHPDRDGGLGFLEATPVLPVLAIEIPIRELLMKLLSTLA